MNNDIVLYYALTFLAMRFTMVKIKEGRIRVGTLYRQRLRFNRHCHREESAKSQRTARWSFNRSPRLYLLPFWGGLLHSRFEEPEYNNDFAAFAAHVLHDQTLAERLAVLDPIHFDTMDALRAELIDLIDARLDEIREPAWVDPETSFILFAPKSLFSIPTNALIAHWIWQNFYRRLRQAAFFITSLTPDAGLQKELTTFACGSKVLTANGHRLLKRSKPSILISCLFRPCAIKLRKCS